jgi:hypothetical protein
MLNRPLPWPGLPHGFLAFNVSPAAPLLNFIVRLEVFGMELMVPTLRGHEGVFTVFAAREVSSPAARRLARPSAWR